MPPTPPRRRRLDVSGDGDFTDTDELDDAGTFNVANEWLTRDLDNNSGTSGNNFTLAYDAAGNMTDDGRSYEYVWDGFGRLRQVKRTDNQALIAEYRYNGLGYRLSWKYDTDGDSDVDGSDQTYFFVYDLKWRPVATFRGADANPKERFIFHNAGLAGRGSSSYIDAVIMRDRDANAGWTAASDATLEERRYYCQNWRADVVALLESDGDVSEWVRYSAYGEATVYPFVNGDYNADGGVDGDDVTAFLTDQDNNVSAADVDRSGAVDGDDVTAFYASWDNDWSSTAWTSGGGLPANAGQLSVTSGNRIGYAGYQFDPATEQYHVRHRVYSPEMGRWTSRDPLGYTTSASLSEYCDAMPVALRDAQGLDPRGGTCLGIRCGPTNISDQPWRRREWEPPGPGRPSIRIGPGAPPIPIPRINVPEIIDWLPPPTPDLPSWLTDLTAQVGAEGGVGFCITLPGLPPGVVMCGYVTASYSTGTCICHGVDGPCIMPWSKSSICVKLTMEIGFPGPRVVLGVRSELGLQTCPRDYSGFDRGNLCQACSFSAFGAGFGCQICGDGTISCGTAAELGISSLEPFSAGCSISYCFDNLTRHAACRCIAVD